MNSVNLRRADCRASGGAAVCELAVTRLVETQAIRDVEAELLRLAREAEVGRVVIDCGRMRGFSSLFFSMLLRLRTALGEATEVRICAMHPELERGYRVARMDELIPAFATVAAALADDGGEA